MGKDSRQRLRELAEELAELEGNIFFMRNYAPGNPLHTLKAEEELGKPPKNGMISWAAGTVAAALVFPPAALFTGWKAYKANQAYKEKRQKWDDDRLVQQGMIRMVAQAESRRKEILEELDNLFTENPLLDKNYWWKWPENNPAMGDQVTVFLPGRTVSPGEWEFGLLHQFWTKESGPYLYLYDMKKTAVLLHPGDVMEMLNPENSRVLYKNDRLLTAKAKGFRLMHFYAYHIDQIQEVQKTTVRTAVDKEAERRAYQRKLDIQESILNGIGSRNFMSDEEMVNLGKMGAEEYVLSSTARATFEADFENKLAARGDYEERSTYSKSFRGLSSIALYNCADVLISTEPETDGWCAAITVPREEQSIMRLTVRSVEPDNPFVGRLESYGDIPEFEMLESGLVSVKMAVDMMANPEIRKYLHLQNRDVLEEKPDLDPYEYAYLIWNDTKI